MTQRFRDSDMFAFAKSDGPGMEILTFAQLVARRLARKAMG